MAPNKVWGDEMKIALVGDSVFDNSRYLKSGEKDTIQHLQDQFPKHECILRAVDGSVTNEVTHLQISSLEDDVDILFVSSGGNDALQYSNIIYSGFTPEVMSLLYDAKVKFYEEYEEMILSLKARNKPFAVFTIYNGCFTEDIQKAATVAISIFNDVIYQVCNKHKVKVIEIRDIISTKEDFANEIEPSSIGSLKLAKAIRGALKR